MELRTSLYLRDVMRGYVLKWRLSVLDTNCQLCLTLADNNENLSPVETQMGLSIRG